LFNTTQIRAKGKFALHKKSRITKRGLGGKLLIQEGLMGQIDAALPDASEKAPQTM